MIWLTIIAATLTRRAGEHIAITGIINPGPRLRTAVGVLASTTVLLVLATLGVQGVLMVLKTTQQISPALGIKMSWVFASVPVGVILMLVALALRHWVPQRTGFDDREGS